MTFEPTGATPRMLVPVTVTASTSGPVPCAMAWSIKGAIKSASVDPPSISFCESAFMRVPLFCSVVFVLKDRQASAATFASGDLPSLRQASDFPQKAIPDQIVLFIVVRQSLLSRRGPREVASIARKIDPQA